MKHILSTITLAFIILGLARAELAAAISTFDSDTEGWLAIGGKVASRPVTFVATAGNPGGHVQVYDYSAGGVIYFSAPAQFLGDFSAAYGTTLEFDLMQFNDDIPSRPTNTEDILLVGAGLTLAFDTASNPTGVWSSYLVPLIETAGWHLTNLAGATPTQAQMQSVLADLTAVRIRAEYRSSGFQTALDNVRLLPLVENGHPYVQYDGWRGFKNASANGGSDRLSNITNDAVTYKFTGTSIQWITRKGPTMGKALVTIDGVSKGTLDLYNSSTLWNQQILFGGLTSAAHTIVIKVTGTKNAGATDYNVALDGFLVGSATKAVQESARAIQYNSWLGQTQSAASGGSYRSNGNLGAVVRLRFSGTYINFITARGPGYGKVNVYIDGVLKSSNLDLYAASQQWQYALPYSGLASTNHTIEIRPTHTKNASSTGYGVVVDAFTGPFTPLP